MQPNEEVVGFGADFECGCATTTIKARTYVCMWKEAKWQKGVWAAVDFLNAYTYIHANTYDYIHIYISVWFYGGSQSAH